MPKMSGRKLTSRQYKALEALLRGATITAAASDANTSEKTVRRWLDDPTFAAELKNERREIVERVATRLVALSDQAVAYLADVMKNPSLPGQSNRRLAAVGVLDVCHKWLQLAILEERVAKLEEVLLYGNTREADRRT